MRASSAPIPGPWSVTMNSTVSATAFCTVNVITPCCGENLIALSSRLNRICFTLPASAAIGGRAGSALNEISTSRVLACSSHQVETATGLRQSAESTRTSLTAGNGTFAEVGFPLRRPICEPRWQCPLRSTAAGSRKVGYRRLTEAHGCPRRLPVLPRSCRPHRHLKSSQLLAGRES
jgi:hypothetical protein